MWKRVMSSAELFLFGVFAAIVAITILRPPSVDHESATSPDVCQCCSNPCQNGGKCIEGANGFTCECAIGYEGTQCETRSLKQHHHKHFPDQLEKIEESLENLTERLADMQNTIRELAFGRTSSFPAASCEQLYSGGQHVSVISLVTIRTPVQSSNKSCAVNLVSSPHTTCCENNDCSADWSDGLVYLSLTTVDIYCDMTAGGGWTRVADIDARRNRCPSNLRHVSSPVYVCALETGPGCTSNKFSTLGIAYSEVRGYAYGHQFFTTDAFGEETRQHFIDRPYVDGVSITYGTPRKHVWTFASGYSRSSNLPLYNCPCAQYPGPSPASFVGNDYYCESGVDSNHQPAWYDKRLWDGHCYSESKCCNHNDMPYFIKALGAMTTDELEVRLCVNEELVNENIGVEKIELFIR